MNYWKAYTNLIKQNCSPFRAEKDLAYWRNNFFAGIIFYLLPLCLIALIPGLVWIYTIQAWSLAVVDLLTFAAIITVAFLPGISLVARKIIFILSSYLLGIALLYYVGLSGPGLMYLMAVCVFSLLIFPAKYAFWPALANTIILILFAIALTMDWLPWHQKDLSLGSFIAISSNLAFLSFLSAALIPVVFKGLQQTIDKGKRLSAELKAKQQSLEKALQLLESTNIELEQFAYVASHDLKEPLRMVSSFMSLLKNKYNDKLDDKAHTYIDFAIDGGNRMQRMIEDLLELSRTASQHLIKVPVDINIVVEEVQQNLFKIITDNKVAISISQKLPILSVYKSDISRLFQNLVSNAVKFRKKDVDPIIHIRFFENTEEYQFEIEDNGIGIEKEKHNKIFEIFSRLHSQKTHEGNGIGLAVCKKVVEHYGGKLWVQSEPGRGSKFCFTIKK